MNKTDTIEELKSKLNAQELRLNAQEQEIINLCNELLYYKRLCYGRRSEKRIPEVPSGQLFLAFDGDPTIAEETKDILPIVKEIEIESHKRRVKKEKKQPSRQEIPAEIERRTTTINPENIDLDKMTKIGEDVREILQFEPGKLYVDRIVRPIYKEKVQEKDSTSTKIYQAPIMETFLPRSIAGSSLLSQVIIGKYVDHLPIYRQLDIFKRLGIKLAASTVNGWIHSVANQLTPLYEALVKEVIASDYIQVDESTIPVIDNQKNKTVKAYLWVVRDVMKKQLFFHYDKGSRAQKVIISLLKDYKGAVQTDGYEAYSIYEKKSGVLLLGCWAHARRKFEVALGEDPVLAGKALDYISLLYQIEANLKNMDISYQEIESERKRLAYPILRDFEMWMQKVHLTLLPKSLMRKAVEYTFSIYARLVRYVSDGRYHIDNNGVENSIRPMAIGRKNYLFCGNHDAAFNTAILYSLLGSCKEAGINPSQWLQYVFENLNDWKANRIAELLPVNWDKLKEK